MRKLFLFCFSKIPICFLGSKTSSSSKKFAASNPLDADTFYNADPEEREKLIGGDNITSYGRALKIAQINLLATDLSIKAQGDFTKLKVIAVGSNMDADMYEQGLNAIVQGYSDSLLDVNSYFKAFFFNVNDQCMIIFKLNI